MIKLPVWSILILLLVNTNCDAIQSKTTIYSPTSDDIALRGRYYTNRNILMYDWSCFRIDFCFQNSKKIVWNAIDTWNIYHVVIDGNITKVIHPKKNNKIAIFETANPQSHCLQIIKITENHYGPLASHKDSIFNGIQIEGGVLIKNSNRYDYKFDFLGDSITTAYGVQSGRNPICFFNMKNIQNCRDSWAVYLSTMFNADYRLQAVSGKGVVRNMVGVPGAKMLSLFSRNSGNSEQNSNKIQDYLPNALFLFIGANDYSNIKNPSINVSKNIEGLHYLCGSGTKIINICDVQFNKELCYNVKTAVKSFSYSYLKTYYLQIPQGTMGKQQTGCMGHPNAKGQKRIAESLYPRVKQILNS